MEKKKLYFPIPIVVEGKYDKMKLCEIVDATLITTEGFGIFNRKEKLALIKRLSENGVVLLCDSDGAGGVIRRYIMSALPSEKIYNLYIPKIEGKERRKRKPSKEGTLGVEGMESEMLYSMLSSFLDSHFDGNMPKRDTAKVTKADFYMYSLTGKKDSRKARDNFCLACGLPRGMTAPALLGAVNVLMGREEFFKICHSLETDI